MIYKFKSDSIKAEYNKFVGELLELLLQYSSILVVIIIEPEWSKKVPLTPVTPQY